MSKDNEKKNWFVKHRVLTVVGALILFVIIASAVTNGSKPNYSISVDNLKNGKITTDCSAKISNLASSTCKSLTITGKVTLDEDSVLLFEKDYYPNVGVTVLVPDFNSLGALDKELALKDVSNSLNKYVNKDGTFSIKLDEESISNDDPSNQEVDNGLIIYNVKTKSVVSKLDLKVTYTLSGNDKTLMASQLVKLNEYNASNKSSTDSVTPSTSSEPAKATDTPAPAPVKSSPPASSTGYQAIYDQYSARLRSECPNLSTMECATVSNEGITKMAEYMYSASGTDGQYATYSDWAGKLSDVYMAEAR